MDQYARLDGKAGRTPHRLRRLQCRHDAFRYRRRHAHPLRHDRNALRQRWRRTGRTARAAFREDPRPDRGAGAWRRTRFGARAVCAAAVVPGQRHRRVRLRQARHRRIRRRIHPGLPDARRRRDRRDARGEAAGRGACRAHRLPGRQPGRLGGPVGGEDRTGGLRHRRLRPRGLAAGRRPFGDRAGHDPPWIRAGRRRQGDGSRRRHRRGAAQRIPRRL